MKTTLASNRALITMSIGGNDVGFAPYVECLVQTIGTGADEKCRSNFKYLDQNAPYLFTSEISTRLTKTYNEILKNTNSKVTLLIVGYPSLAPSTDPDKNVCGIAGGTQGRVYALTQSLNERVRQAVDASAKTYPGRIYFVSPMDPGSPFIGHDMCSSEPYLDGWATKFHPNKKGQQAYATLIATWISNNKSKLLR
jgi:hypothetical protein